MTGHGQPGLDLAPTMAVCWLFEPGQVVYFSELHFLLSNPY